MRLKLLTKGGKKPGLWTCAFLSLLLIAHFSIAKPFSLANSSLNTWETSPNSLNFMEEVTIRGKVLGENGDALPGVTITVENTTSGTVTDLDGLYSITVPEGSTL